MKLIKNLLLVTPLFFIGTIYADSNLCDSSHPCTLIFENATTNVMKLTITPVEGGSTYIKTIASGGYINQPFYPTDPGSNNCDSSYNAKNTYGVTGQLVSADGSKVYSTFETTITLGCGMHSYYQDEKDKTDYWAGFLNPGMPLCTSGCTSGAYKWQVLLGADSKTDDNNITYYNGIKYEVAGTNYTK